MSSLLSATAPFLLAAFLGSILGIQREVERKAAGTRTYALVCLGSCLFTVLSRIAFGGSAFDPSRIASQIVVGVGFLGAGIIFVRGGHVEGLTTAAGLWVTAAIGMATGVGEYRLAIVVTIIAFVLLAVGKQLQIEERFARRVERADDGERSSAAWPS